MKRINLLTALLLLLIISTSLPVQAAESIENNIVEILPCFYTYKSINF